MIPDTVSVQTGVTGDCTLQFFLPGNSHAVNIIGGFSRIRQTELHIQSTSSNARQRNAHTKIAQCAQRENWQLPTQYQQRDNEAATNHWWQPVSIESTPTQRRRSDRRWVAHNICALRSTGTSPFHIITQSLTRRALHAANTKSCARQAGVARDTTDSLDHGAAMARDLQSHLLCLAQVLKVVDCSAPGSWRAVSTR